MAGQTQPGGKVDQVLTDQELRQKFDARWMPEPNTGCWLWIGNVAETGYGRFRSPRTRRAHRVAWELYRGPIPQGMVIDHVCRVRSCVNPDHLRVVTPRVNALENSKCFTAIHASKATCPRGHPYDILKPGQRGCRRCGAERSRRYRQRKALRIPHVVGTL